MRCFLFLFLSAVLGSAAVIAHPLTSPMSEVAHALTPTVDYVPDFGALMPSALKDSEIQVRLEQARAEAIRERAFRARILGELKSRLAQLRTGDLRLRHLQQHLEKEYAEFAVDTGKELPSMWPFSLGGALKAWNRIEKFRKGVWDAHNQETEWEPADDREIDKVSGEIVDFRNEVAICDWLIAAYNAKLADLAKQADRAQQPGPQQPPAPSQKIAGTPHGVGETHGPEHGGEYVHKKPAGTQQPVPPQAPPLSQKVAAAAPHGASGEAHGPEHGGDHIHGGGGQGGGGDKGSDKGADKSGDKGADKGGDKGEKKSAPSVEMRPKT